MELGANEVVLRIHFDFECPTGSFFQHRVHCVVDDVEIYLLDLMWISICIGSSGIDFPLNGDVIDLQVVIAQRKRLVQDLT